MLYYTAFQVKKGFLKSEYNRIYIDFRFGIVSCDMEHSCQEIQYVNGVLCHFVFHIGSDLAAGDVFYSGIIFGTAMAILGIIDALLFQ